MKSPTEKLLREALEYWNRWSTGGNFDGKEAERLTKIALAATEATPPIKDTVKDTSINLKDTPPTGEVPHDPYLCHVEPCDLCARYWR